MYIQLKWDPLGVSCEDVWSFISLLRFAWSECIDISSGLVWLHAGLPRTTDLPVTIPSLQVRNVNRCPGHLLHLLLIANHSGKTGAALIPWCFSVAGYRLKPKKIGQFFLEWSLHWASVVWCLGPLSTLYQKLYYDRNFNVSGLLTSLLGWSQWKPLAMTVMFDGYHKHHKRLLWLIESPFKSVSVACLYLLLEPLLASRFGVLWGRKKTSIRQQHKTALRQR